MRFSLSALVAVAAVMGMAIAADEPEPPQYQCSSDAILVCCEEFTGSVIGEFVGEGSGCTFDTLNVWKSLRSHPKGTIATLAGSQAGPGSCEADYIPGCCRTVVSHFEPFR